MKHSVLWRSVENRSVASSIIVFYREPFHNYVVRLCVAVDRHVPDALQYSLVIDGVRSEDSGTYCAVASNAAGQSRLSLQLLVQPNRELQIPSRIAGGENDEVHG